MSPLRSLLKKKIRMLQLFSKVIAALASAAIVTSCTELKSPHLHNPVDKPIPKNETRHSDTLTRSLVIECPLILSHDEGDSEVDEYFKHGVLIREVYNSTAPAGTREYVNKDGIRVRETRYVGQSVHDMQVIGLCPHDNQTYKAFQFKMDVPRPLSADYSKFTVIDGETYITTDLSHYFSLNLETNNFYVTAEKAKQMWASLEKGYYEFSANILTEDFEMAENYSFEFEIK